MRRQEDIATEINEVETWLREHPHAEWIARHDMIVKLATLKQELESITIEK